MALTASAICRASICRFTNRFGFNESCGAVASRQLLAVSPTAIDRRCLFPVKLDSHLSAVGRLPGIPMRIALFITISLFVCGCRVNPNAEREIALLRAEILDLEDQYYALKSQRDDAVVQLRDCQGPEFDAAQFADPQHLDECIDCGTSSVAYDSSEIIYDDGFDTVIGSAVIENSLAPQDLNTTDQIQSSDQPVPTTNPRPTMEEVPAVEEGDNSNINSSRRNRQFQLSQAMSAIRAIRIHPQLSQGEDLDGTPGHEGISLLIQPVDQAGQVVKSSGQLSVQLMERDRLASFRQLGSWRFTPQEVQNFRVRDDLKDQGFLLHIPWSHVLPTRNQVNVVINFVAGNRQRFSSRLQIPIQPPARRYSLTDDIIASWIESDDRWVGQVRESERVTGEIDLGAEFNDPEFYKTSAGNVVPSVSTESDVDRRTSKPRWRPVR